MWKNGNGKTKHGKWKKKWLTKLTSSKIIRIVKKTPFEKNVFLKMAKYWVEENLFAKYFYRFWLWNESNFS